MIGKLNIVYLWVAIIFTDNQLPFLFSETINTTTERMTRATELESRGNQVLLMGDVTKQAVLLDNGSTIKGLSKLTYTARTNFKIIGAPILDDTAPTRVAWQETARG